MNDIIISTIVALDDSLDFYAGEAEWCFGCHKYFIPYNIEGKKDIIGSCYCSPECYDQWCRKFQHGVKYERSH